MGIKKNYLVIFSLLYFVILYNVYSQDDNRLNYYYELKEDIPFFTQIIRWAKVEDASKYEVSIFDLNDKLVSKVESLEPVCNVNLKPGKYYYKVVAFNLLMQKESYSKVKLLTVNRAILPRIKGISPKIIYIEDGDDKLEIKVPRIAEDWNIYLKNKIRVLKMVKKQIKRNSVVVTFEHPEKLLGEDYIIIIEHPSGLKGESKDLFSIRYRRPIDLYINIGWEPVVLLGDDWVKHIYSKKFMPLGVNATFGIIFAKKYYGFFGAETGISFRDASTIQDTVEMKSFYILSNINLVYEHHFSKEWFGLVSIGGGMAYSYHTFKYNSSATSTPGYNGDIKPAHSFDPFYNIGLGVRWRFLPRWQVGATFAWQQIFHKQYIVGNILPQVYFGYRY